jgi:class 3 adenylate cyclase
VGDESAIRESSGESKGASALPSSPAEFLAMHPLPPALTDLGDAVTALSWVDLDADLDAIWDAVSDYARLSREVGLAPMQAWEEQGQLVGERRYGLAMHRFRELPWEWAYGSGTALTRIYSAGLARASLDAFWVAPLSGGGARVYSCLSWVPRGPLAAMIVRLRLPKAARALCEAVERLASQRIGRAPVIAAPQPLGMSERASARLTSLVEELGDLPAAAVTALTKFLQTADDLELDRVRPLELAARWGREQAEVVRVCLHATRVGLLEMSWDVTCPHCRGVRQRARSLGEVPRKASCEPCEVEFGTETPQVVEITFQPHPSIRERERTLYCTAEPARKRHIVAQQVLAPNERRVLTLRVPEGSYQLRLVGSEGARQVRVDASAAAPAVWAASQVASGDELSAAPGARVTIENDRESPQIFVLEQVEADGHALRPAHLFSHPEFRDLFSEEYLAAGVHLHVGEQTILFTDVVGSTEFYAARGDPEAFVAVVRHFEEIELVVAEHGGAVVKTIGDAAMAAFADPVGAVASAAELLARFSSDRQDTPIRIRASLNVGSCIAVRLNSNIDYFGTTVNVAAKLQAFAGTGELALSASVLRAPGVDALLRELGAPLKTLTFEDAPGGPMTVYRWGPPVGIDAPAPPRAPAPAP